MRVWKSAGTTGGETVEDTVHRAETDNPHSVTKAQVGLGSAEDTADLDKPVSTATQTALDLKADDADLTAHIDATDNPHVVTKAQVGLTNAEDTTDLGKPVSTATQTALDLKQDAHAALDVVSSAPAAVRFFASDAMGDVAWVTHSSDVEESSDLSDYGDTTPTDGNVMVGDGDSFESRALAKGDVGLGNVDNIADTAKVVSDATQTALDGKANTSHTHSLTDITDDGALAALNTVGTSQIDDTAVTLAKMANLAQATFVGRADGAGTGVPTALDATTARTAMGLGSLATLSTIGTTNITDAAVTLAKMADLVESTLVGRATGAGTGVPTALTPTEAKTLLALVKADVGLGSVHNTADEDKPVSTATNTALGLKQDASTELTDLSDVSAVTVNFIPVVNATQDGYDFVAHDAIGGVEFSDLTDTGTMTPTNRNIVIADGDSWESDVLVAGDIPDISATYSPVTHNHNSTYGAIATVATNSAHVADTTTNPHSVTATQVGLGNVANKSEASMVASGAIADELNTKRLVISNQSFSSTDTIVGDSDDIFVEVTGATTLTLPTAVTGRRVTIHNTDATETCTVEENTSDEIWLYPTGVVTASLIVAGGSRVFVAVDATRWIVAYDPYIELQFETLGNQIDSADVDIAALQEPPMVAVTCTDDVSVSAGATADLGDADGSSSTVVQDPGTWHTSSGSAGKTFTVPQDGWYQIGADAQYTTTSSDRRIGYAVNGGGTRYRNSGVRNVSFTEYVELVEDDTIVFTTYSDDAATVTASRRYARFIRASV